MSTVVDLDRPADKPLVIYRPPSSSIPSTFYDEMSDLLTKVGECIDADRFIMCGDFNCPGPNSTVDAELISLFDFHGLQQHVSSPTHHTTSTNNILDLVVGSSGSDRIASVEVHPSNNIFDHDLLMWSVARLPRPPRNTITYGFRNIKSIDHARFREDIMNSSLFSDPADSASEWVKTDDPRRSKMTLHHPVTVSLMFIETTPTKPEVVALRLSTGMK